MRSVQACDLAPEAPAGLEALVVAERPRSGPSARLYAVGDVGFCGHLAAPLDFDPWAEVAPVLRAGDVTFANLETPLVSSDLLRSLPGGQRPFVGLEDSAPTLAAGGFDLVSVANNHVADAGPAGIASTLGALHRSGVVAVGAGAGPEQARRLVVTEAAGGLRIGWLACARTLQAQAGQSQPKGEVFWELDATELLDAVTRARSEVDVLVVSLHLGFMYVEYPSPEHRRLALDLAAAGADLVVAHHAHVLQGIEVAERRAGTAAGICHNLGNFLFDWTVGRVRVDGWVDEQRSGVVVAADVDAEGLRRLAALPTRVDDGWVVRWAVGEDGRAILDRLRRISAELAGDSASAFRRQRAERNTGLALRALGRAALHGEIGPLLEALPRLRPRHASMMLRWLGRRLGGSVGGGRSDR